MTVADFGAGSGHYTLAIAKIVGNSGVVYAVDVQQDLLARIKSHAQKEDLKNVEIIWADLDKSEGSRLTESSVDFIVISNLLFQTEDKEAVIKEASRVLKSGGKIAVIDWSDSFGGLGPKREDIIDKESCKKIFLETGLILNKEFEAGEHHYGFIFKKQ